MHGGMTASPCKKKKREERILKKSKDPDVLGTILDVAKFAVNEQNKDKAKRGHKLIQLGRVLEANLKFNSDKLHKGFNLWKRYFSSRLIYDILIFSYLLWHVLIRN